MLPMIDNVIRSVQRAIKKGCCTIIWHAESQRRRCLSKLQTGKKQPKSAKCQRCRYDTCQGAKKCPANGKTCAKRKKLNNVAQACHSKGKPAEVNQVSDSGTDEGVCGRIHEVKKLTNDGIATEVTIKAFA